MNLNNCKTCRKEIHLDCDWQQGRCPHRPSMINEILLDNYKTRYYNLLLLINNGLKRLFKK
jgi:hypothetical protein